MKYGQVHRLLDASEERGTDRLILLALVARTDDKGECWPSRKLLAHDCRLSEATIKRRVKRLVASGAITTLDPGHPDNPNRSRLYRVNLGGSQLCTPSRVTAMTPEQERNQAEPFYMPETERTRKLKEWTENELQWRAKANAERGPARRAAMLAQLPEIPSHKKKS